MEFLNIKYSAKDIRYTTKGNTIYAILLGPPESNKSIVLESFSDKMLPEKVDIKKVEMMGSDEKIVWSVTDHGLELITPAEQTDEMAVVFKIVI